MQVNIKEQRLRALIEGLLDRWQLGDAERAGLMGEWPVHEHSEHIQERCAALLEIHAALRLLFGGNPELRYAWVSTHNAHFDGQRPLDVMIAERQAGIARVKTYLMSQLQ